VTDTDHLDQRLRAADPAMDADLDPRGPVATRLRLRIEESGAVRSPRSRPVRRGVVAIVVLMLVATSGVAVASGPPAPPWLWPPWWSG
jgi:hypothetical protein